MIDIEADDFNDKTNAMLEIYAITIGVNENSVFSPKDVCHFHGEPFESSNLEAETFKFNSINIHSLLRMAGK